MSCKHYSFVLVFLLSACASNQWQASEVEEVFVVDIKSSGLKIFDYSLTKAMLQAGGGGRRGGSSGKGSGKHAGRGGTGGSSADNGLAMKEYFNAMLESKLKKTAYCRQGYIELDSYLGKGQLQLRGECEEAATEEDRIKFANNLPTISNGVDSSSPAGVDVPN